MELVSVYLYNRIPIELLNISNQTFHSLKRNGWYNDIRTNKKFTMLNKRFEIEGQWYRAMIRFEYNGLSPDKHESFTLSLPCPFLITECEKLEEDRWKDTKTYHGPKLKNVTGFLEAGLPSSIIDLVYSDLENNVVYI